MLWFHGSMLCNWSFWLYIGETGSKINCLLWWGYTRKTRHQRLILSQRVSLGKGWKIVFDAATHKHTRAHTPYMLSQHQSFEGGTLQQLPQRDVLWESCEVRCFHLWPGGPSGSLQQRMDPDTQRKSLGVCHSGHNLNLPSLISLEENGTEDEIVTMCVAAYVRCIMVCVCNHHTLFCASWHHFPSSGVCCNSAWHFQTLLSTHILSPKSVEGSSSD